ncbi:MAG: translation initiation factor IF-2 [Alistipes sp.]|jgi:translation initiation factor IF-2|nr:translation initiation factor IF-2 [Alistipes sp.]MDD7711429.1 translation initiation factor IF-2 [Alistipes sp.]CDD16305.1 translation initiation factor IF-2 [Alistipes sp. CAG:435]
MAEIRLNKIIRTYNIGLQNLVDFLSSKGVEVEANPNAKISDEHLPAIEKQFGKDLELKQASEKVDIKLNEILEKTSRKQQESAKEEEYEPVRETVIKTTIFTPVEPKPEPETIRPVVPEPQPEIKPEPQPEPVVETPVAETVKEPEPQPEVKPEPAERPVEETPAEKPKAEVTESKPEPQPEVKKVETAKETVPEPTTPAAGKDIRGGERPMSKHEKKLAAAARQKEEQAKAKHQQHPEGKPERNEEKPATESSTPGLKVLGKIDLSQFEPKKGNKKRERIAKGSQKVDVAKEGKQADNSSRKDKNKNARQAQEQGKGGKKRNRGADRFKPAMTEEEQEAMQKEIQKQVKETYARMNDNKKNNFGAKYRKEKREQAAAKSQEEMAQEIAEKKVLKVTEFVTVNDLATLMNNTPVNEVIKACMDLGLMVSINQRLDAEALVLVAEQFGYKVEFVTADLTEEIKGSSEQADREEDLVPRPPIITVMGHVDHGKTSLLDYIRKSNVIAGEAGGITQHIGAYNVKLPDGRRITFLDTPGHEAFTAMRARGAQLTDLAIIIIAADDAVMPQTVEAINHAQAANVPMVFAINKIDKPGAQPERIYQQLAQMNILTEAWGGKYQCQEISAKKGLNVDKLLEKVLLETDLLDLKANPNKNGVGAVIESSLDKGRGYLATVLVQDGTLKTGDMVLSGSYYGRVKAMFNERGQKVKEAGPSTPVSILGLNGAPSAGDKFNVMSDEKEAKAIANKREQLLRIQGIKTQKHMTLEEIGRRIAIGNFKELNVIVKGDVDGSVEALSDSLIKLSTEQVRVNVIHKAVGAISESDVILAEASDAVIIGFQVRPSTDARKLADEQGIEIRLYSVIYDAINDVKDGIEGMLEPIKKEEITGTAEVKQTFKISKVGTIAGCLVRDGKIAKTAQCRLIRDGIVVYTGELASLKRGKDDVKEVSAGMECGIGIDKFNDLKVGDNIEAFVITEIKQTLD